MANNSTSPSLTPNVIVANPLVRKWSGNILAGATLILSIVTLVDGAVEQINFADWTGPAALIIAGLFGIFQLSVTSPNVPTPTVEAKANDKLNGGVNGPFLGD